MEFWKLTHRAVEAGLVAAIFCLRLAKQDTDRRRAGPLEPHQPRTPVPQLLSPHARLSYVLLWGKCRPVPN